MNTDFKLTVATMCNNEEKILPFFLHHYLKIADEIIILDDESTDNTEKIINQFKTKNSSVLINYIKIKTGGWDDHKKINIHKLIQKNSFNDNSDWYMIVDTDEFLYSKSKNIRNILKENYDKNNWLLKPIGYQMCSDSMPEYNNNSILDLCKEGVRCEGFDKPLIVRKEVDWSPSFGSHTAIGFINENQINPHKEEDILLLHYKMMGSDYRLSRIQNTKSRLTELGVHMAKNMNISAQIFGTEEGLLGEFNYYYSRREMVI